MKSKIFKTLSALACFAAFISGSQAVAQGKPKVAVYQIKDPANSGFAAQLQEQIRVAIVNTKKFSVFSRDFSSAEEENALVRDGRLTRNASNQQVQYEAVDYSVQGSITAATILTETTPPGKLFGISYAACTTQSLSLVANITITDNGTGETLYAAPVTKTYQERCQAVNIATVTSDISNKLAFEFASQIFPMKAIQTLDQGRFVLNYGGNFLPVGTFVTVSTPAVAVETAGGSFSGFGTTLGQARVEQVQPDAVLVQMMCMPAVTVPLNAVATVDEKQKKQRCPKGKKRRK